MSKYTATFSRNEIKFVFDSSKRQKLEQLLNRYLVSDQYGEHTICNVYFDNEYDESIILSQEKPLYKEKVRLRSYNVPNEYSKVYLEVKKKFCGVVYKRRLEIELKEANDYAFANKLPRDSSQTFQEIDYVCTNQNLQPAMYIAYDRIAYTDEYPDGLRVTLDKNVRWRDTDLKMEHGDYGNVLNPDEIIMEIKTSTSIPNWLAEGLSELQIYTSSCSKYGRCYQERIEGIKQ